MPTSRSRRRFLVRGGFALAGAVLTGCGQQDGTPPPAATGSTQAVPQDAPSQAAASTSLPQTSGTIPSEQTPTVLTFTATDPSSVILAAGRPQFVEFFAFW